MLLIKYITVFLLAYLGGELVARARKKQEQYQTLCWKYVTLSTFAVSLTMVILISIFVIIFGLEMFPVLSLLSVMLAFYVGFEFSNLVSANFINYKGTLVILVISGLLIWPIFYFLVKSLDTITPENLLSPTVGALEFCIIMLFSTLMGPTIEHFSDRHL